MQTNDFIWNVFSSVKTLHRKSLILSIKIYENQTDEEDREKMTSQLRVTERGTTRRTMTTDRLVLRPSEDERDLENYLAHIEAENEFLFQYGQEKSDELLGMIDFHTAPVAYFTVFLKGTRTMVGYVGVTTANGGSLDEGNLEFHIFKEYRRNGFCKEAARLKTKSPPRALFF